MPAIIDVSSNDLRKDAVVELIKDHVVNPGPKPLVFRVSQEVLGAFRRPRSGGISVTSAEADEINRFVGKVIRPEDYWISKRHTCVKCRRIITFYDVFHAGRKLHGDDHIRRFIAGGGYHIQVHQKDPVLMVDCTACGTPNRFDDGCYECGDYTYA